MMVTERKKEREREGPGRCARAQMSSLLKQGFPHFHVRVPHAMTHSSQNKRGEERGTHRAHTHTHSYMLTREHEA